MGDEQAGFVKHGFAQSQPLGIPAVRRLPCTDRHRLPTPAAQWFPPRLSPAFPDAGGGRLRSCRRSTRHLAWGSSTISPDRCPGCPRCPMRTRVPGAGTRPAVVVNSRRRADGGGLAGSVQAQEGIYIPLRMHGRDGPLYSLNFSPNRFPRDWGSITVFMVFRI